MASGRREFREEAVKMVVDGPHAIVVVARELGVLEGMLGNWVNTYRRAHVAQRIYDAEHSVAQIAAMFGVPHATVYGHPDKTSVGNRPPSPVHRGPGKKHREPAMNRYRELLCGW